VPQPITARQAMPHSIAVRISSIGRVMTECRGEKSGTRRADYASRPALEGPRIIADRPSIPRPEGADACGHCEPCCQLIGSREVNSSAIGGLPSPLPDSSFPRRRESSSAPD
jgi:hypothetical protein